MRIINIKALLAFVLTLAVLALPTFSVHADEVDSTAKVCDDGKPCSTENAPAESPPDEESTDDELEDSCEDDGVF